MHLDAEVFRLWASGMIDVCNHDRECRCKYDVYIYCGKVLFIVKLIL